MAVLKDVSRTHTGFRLSLQALSRVEIDPSKTWVKQDVTKNAKLQTLPLKLDPLPFKRDLLPLKLGFHNFNIRPSTLKSRSIPLNLDIFLKFDVLPLKLDSPAS